MAGQNMFGTTIRVLDNALDLRAKKLEAISANIANAETPGYSRLRMDFEEALREAAAGSATTQTATHPQHFGSAPGGGAADVEAHIYRDMQHTGVGDNNNVSLEREMVDLAENQIRYEAATRMLSKRFNMLKMVIRGQA